MSTISSGIKTDSSFMNLKPIDTTEIRKEVIDLLIGGETIVSAFKTIRDQVVFTDKRVFVVNVQGVTGKKISFFSYPYAKVQYFGIETAGLLDIDSELIMTFSNGAVLQFDFKSSVNIREISRVISQYIL